MVPWGKRLPHNCAGLSSDLQEPRKARYSHGGGYDLSIPVVRWKAGTGEPQQLTGQLAWYTTTPVLLGKMVTETESHRQPGAMNKGKGET